TRIIPAMLAAYQLDPKDTASYYQTDVAKAKQLLAAANFDTNRSWQILVGTPGSVTDQAAQIIQRQWSQAGVKTTIDAITTSTFLRWQPGEYEVTMTGS